MAQKIHLINGVAHPDSQPLGKKDTVLWISHDTAYIVDFGSDSPFGQNAFFVEAGGSEPSGKIKSNAKNRKYPYTPTQVFTTKTRKKKAGKKMAKKKMSAGGPDVEILP